MTHFRLSRRGVLTGAAGLAVAGPARASGPAGSFTHSVASGDPLATRVMLWTRFVPARGTSATLQWQVATDASFARIVRSGSARATAARDYTVKVDVGGLQPDTAYAYRFIADQMSQTGQTRTLPAGAVDTVKIAVFSCANLPFGYFHAYAHAAARDDLHLALHLGDYLYEYKPGVYPSAREAMADRPLDPPTEIIALADYRKRYANYRSDPDLQAVHKKLPFICIWDDHELANDAWKGGAENHDPKTDGSWAKRRAAAIQAYSEWMPIRDQRGGKIYRRFDIGTLASLIMLDTRDIGRDKQMNYTTDLRVADATPRPEELKTAAASFRKKWADEKRSLLGAAQEKWFAAQVTSSAASKITWQIIGQQIQTGFLKTPTALPKALPADAPDWLKTRVTLGALMSSQNLPANLDAWAGYPAARTRMINLLMSEANNAIILAGDTHNAWLFELGSNGDKVAAVEFGGQSVSSPGYESSIKLPPDDVSRMLLADCPELKWCNTVQRGYMVTSLTPAAASNDWIFLDGIRSKTYTVASTKTARGPATSGKGTAHAEMR